jgi:hypothetical protein
MDREEMVTILEEIARDEEVNPTARVTALRVLKEFPKPAAVDESLYHEGNVLPMTGPVARAKQRLKAEE